MATKVSSYLTKLGFRQLEHVADAANYNNETGGEYIVIRENTRIYLYDATSNAPIDSISILPTSDGGASRWIAVGGGAMTQYKISYTFESYSNEIPLGMTVLSKANIFYVNIENTQILSTEFNLNDAKDTIVLSKPFEAGVRTEVVIFVGDYQPESRDYELLTNKPMVNGITLVGNRSLGELGIQPAGDYATNTRVNTVENTLENKKADKATTLAGYNIGDAYTKTEVDQLINEKEYLPDQTGNSGKFLTTNGTTASWETAVDYDNITNCITEIPQDIKLELKDGILTLKAGSKVYVPNGKNADGSNKFDVKILSQDLQYKGFYSDTRTIVVKSDLSGLDGLPASNMHSGNSIPTNTQYMFWYDTANNIIKLSIDTGSSWTGQYSFPICVETSSSSAITFIDQVFNGFGYIGSTVFALPGVKGLIPNGRNEDGSLKNIETTVNKVAVLTFTSNVNTPYNGRFLLNSSGGIFARVGGYDSVRNYIMAKDGVTILMGCSFTEGCLVEAGVIKTFIPKTVFHAVDYSDFENKLNTKQDTLTAGNGIKIENNTITNTYEVPENVVTSDNYVNSRLWKGTLAEYDALTTYDDAVTYFITDDNAQTQNTMLANKINALEARIAALEAQLNF